MRFLGAIATLCLCAGVLLGQAAAKKKTMPAGRTAASKSASAAPSRSKKTGVAKRVAVQQQQPTSDRYREIQQALADKGYFHGAPDGAWNGESVDALKRFQKDQNLDPDGKIGALSLMALGLGPKHGVPSAQASKTGG